MSALAVAFQLIGAIVAEVQDYENKSADAQAQSMGRLQGALAIMSNDQAKANADIAASDAATLAKLQELAAHPALPAPVADALNSMADQLRERFASPLPAAVAMIGDKPL